MAGGTTTKTDNLQEWAYRRQEFIEAEARLARAQKAVEGKAAGQVRPEEAHEFLDALDNFERASRNLAGVLNNITPVAGGGIGGDPVYPTSVSSRERVAALMQQGEQSLINAGVNPLTDINIRTLYDEDVAMAARSGDILASAAPVAGLVNAAMAIQEAANAADAAKGKEQPPVTKPAATGGGGTGEAKVEPPPPAPKPAPLPAPLGHYQGIPIYFHGPDGNMPGLPVNDIEAKKLTDAGLSYGVTPTNLIERGQTGLVLLGLDAQRSGGPGSPRRADVILSMSGVGANGNTQGFTMGLSGIINAINKGQLAGELADQLKTSVEDNAKFRFGEKYNTANPLMNPFANTKPIALDTFGNVVPVDGEDVSPEHYRELALVTGRPYAGPGVEHGQFYTEVNGKIEVGGKVDEADLAIREIYERTGVTPGAGQATPREGTPGTAFVNGIAVPQTPTPVTPPDRTWGANDPFTRTLDELLEVYGGNLSVPQRDMLRLEYGRAVSGKNPVSPFEFLTQVWPGVADLRPIEARFPRVSQSSSNPRRVNF